MPPPLRSVANTPPDDEEIEVHPLFAGAHAVKPLKAPIEAIDVMRVVKGKLKFVKWLPADELPDEEAILYAFGPGDYELVGRSNERKKIVSRARVSVGDDDDASDDDSPAIAPPDQDPPKTSASELFSLFERMQASRDREAAEQRAREQQLVATTIAAIQQSANTTLQAVTMLANARIADQKEMMAAFASQKSSQMPHQMMALVRDAFETGRSMQEPSGEEGDSDMMTAALTALVAMMQGRPPQPPPAQAPTPPQEQE